MTDPLLFALFLGAIVISVWQGLVLFLPVCFGIVLFFLRGLGRGFSGRRLSGFIWDETQKVLPATIIFLIIGAVTATWRACGTITFFIIYGVQIIRPPVFILVAFLLTALLSFALGTSFGVAGTAGIILMALARSGGVSEAITAGAILSGAFFGDRCSNASSSAIVVAAVTQTDLMSNLRLTQRSGLVPLAVTALLYLPLSLTHPIGAVDTGLLSSMRSVFSLSPLVVLPAVVMLVLPLLKVPVRRTMAISVALALGLMLFAQRMSVAESFLTIVRGYRPENQALTAILSGGGILSMVETILAVLSTSAFAGLLEGIGVLNRAKDLCQALAGRVGLFPAMIITSILTAVIFCNQLVAVVMGQQLLCGVYQQRGCSRQELALDIENSAIVLPPLIPWNVACHVPLTMLGGTPAALPYAIFLYMVPLCCLFTKRHYFPHPKKEDAP